MYIGVCVNFWCSNIKNMLFLTFIFFFSFTLTSIFEQFSRLKCPDLLTSSGWITARFAFGLYAFFHSKWVNTKEEKKNTDTEKQPKKHIFFPIQPLSVALQLQLISVVCCNKMINTIIFFSNYIKTILTWLFRYPAL